MSITDKHLGLKYFAFSIIPGLAFFLVTTVHFLQSYLTLPNAVLIFGLPRQWGEGRIALFGAALHMGVFLLANLYVPLLAKKRSGVFDGWKIWIPSVLGTLIFFGLSFIFIAGGWEYGIQFQGITHVKILLLAHILGFGVGVLWLTNKIWKTFAGQGKTTPSEVLAYNCLLHLFLITVMFPYLGEGL